MFFQGLISEIYCIITLQLVVQFVYSICSSIFMPRLEYRHNQDMEHRVRLLFQHPVATYQVMVGSFE